MTADLVRIQLTTALPETLFWPINGSMLRLDFTPARSPLVQPVGSDLKQVANLLILGHQDYASGGGSAPLICLDVVNFRIVLFDLEAEQTQTALNSDIDRFIATVRLFDEAFRLGTVVTRTSLSESDSNLGAYWYELRSVLERDAEGSEL